MLYFAPHPLPFPGTHHYHHPNCLITYACYCACRDGSKKLCMILSKFIGIFARFMTFRGKKILAKGY